LIKSWMKTSIASGSLVSGRDQYEHSQCFAS
jgi:hypothetical protein